MRRLLVCTICFASLSFAADTPFKGPGDFRGDYESSTYETRSLPLQSRTGQPADLVARAKVTPLGLPPVPVPADNRLSTAKVELGRKLFYDRRLSLNGTQSCAMCHIPEQGFANNELAIAVGFEGRTVGRNAPTLYNVAYQERLFHDAREFSLENQAWQPMIHPNEMATPAIGLVLRRLETLADYDGLFEAAFDRGPSMDTVGMALASYQRTLISGNSPFDRWYYGAEDNAVDAAAKRGFQIFVGKGGCSSCHLVGKESALFTDHKTHNTGIGYERSMGNDSKTVRVLVAPGLYAEIASELVQQVSEKTANDLGRYRVSQDPNDRWGFRTPTLRNVALTAPYMHDGSFPTLEAVVAFYNQGGIPNDLLSPKLEPLNLTTREQNDLVAFLESLTGEYEALVSDAFAAPVGEW